MDILLLALTLLIGLILGFLLGRRKPRRSLLASADNDDQLSNELLEQEVKQLKAQVVTLEKALERALA